MPEIRRSDERFRDFVEGFLKALVLNAAVLFPFALLSGSDAGKAAGFILMFAGLGPLFLIIGIPLLIAFCVSLMGKSKAQFVGAASFYLLVVASIVMSQVQLAAERAKTFPKGVFADPIGAVQTLAVDNHTAETWGPIILSSGIARQVVIGQQRYKAESYDGYGARITVDLSHCDGNAEGIFMMQAAGVFDKCLVRTTEMAGPLREGVVLVGHKARSGIGDFSFVALRIGKDGVPGKEFFRWERALGSKPDDPGYYTPLEALEAITGVRAIERASNAEAASRIEVVRKALSTSRWIFIDAAIPYLFRGHGDQSRSLTERDVEDIMAFAPSLCESPNIRKSTLRGAREVSSKRFYSIDFMECLIDYHRARNHNHFYQSVSKSDIVGVRQLTSVELAELVPIWLHRSGDRRRSQLFLENGLYKDERFAGKFEIQKNKFCIKYYLRVRNKNPECMAIYLATDGRLFSDNGNSDSSILIQINASRYARDNIAY